MKIGEQREEDHVDRRADAETPGLQGVLVSEVRQDLRDVRGAPVGEESARPRGWSRSRWSTASPPL